jgi:hypothetical protein
VDKVDEAGNVSQVSEVVPAGKQRIEIVVNDRGTDRTHRYNEFVSPATWFASLVDDASKEAAFSRYAYAENTEERASVREAIAAESTVISVDGKNVDLMELALNRAILAVNGTYFAAAGTGKKVQNAFIVTRRKLIESGKAVDKEGVLVAA